MMVIFFMILGQMVLFLPSCWADGTVSQPSSRGSDFRLFSVVTGSLDADAYRLWWGGDGTPEAGATLAVGDVVSRISTPAGLRAVVHARGLSSPDGLALHPVTGDLYVAEETAGQVCRVSGDACIPVLWGLSSPEGIAFSAAGDLYALEDVEDGRLWKLPAGSADPLVVAEHLDAPEDIELEPGGTFVFTESTVQFSQPLQYRTRVSRFDPSSGQIVQLRQDALLWSYSGLEISAGGQIYVCNEASGVGTRHSVFKLDPVTGERSLFVTNLVAPEGLSLTAAGEFPLLVAEEDTGAGNGRLTSVAENGSRSVFATGFLNIEDVVVDGEGRIYVTEDSSGMVLRIEPEPSPVGLGWGWAGFLILFFAIMDGGGPPWLGRPWNASRTRINSPES